MKKNNNNNNRKVAVPKKKKARKRNRTNRLIQGVTAPISESKILKTYYEFKNDTITFCQPLFSTYYSGSLGVVPMHPLMHYGRLNTLAGQFTEFTLVNAHLHWVPTIGTTSVGMVAIGSVRHCVPLTYDTASQFSNLCNMYASVCPVWMPQTFDLMDVDRETKNLQPSTRTDIPNTFYVVGNGLAGTLSASGTIFISASFRLSRPAPLVENTAGSMGITFTTSALGVQTTVATVGTFKGVVITSTATNVDVGEFLHVPPLPVVTTDYIVPMSHNDNLIDYDSGPDQGAMVCNGVLFN